MRGHRGGRPRSFDSYKAATALPTDPAALLRWAYAQTPDVTGAGSTDDAEAFNILRGILGNGVLPDHLQASVFRAMERIPGVAVRTVDVLGRPTLAPGQTGEWLRQELLLDPETYAYRGQRSTVVKNATINPLKAGNSTGRVYKGHTVVAERLAARVVDRPGAR